MKIWILFDMHLDAGGEPLAPPPEADIAVVAGDICDDRWIEDTSRLLPVIFVAGNHELYHHNFRERMAGLRALCGAALLDNSEITVGGVRFVGCTLWTDYNRGSTAAMDEAWRTMSDHRLIEWQEDPWGRFCPEDALNLHRQSVLFLRNSTCDNNPPDMPTVVVTHHAPSVQSIHPRYRDGALLNHAFASDLDYLVEGSGAALWVHGHTHDVSDYEIGETRVLCNPHGYPHEVGKNGFNPTLIVEVGN